MLKVIIFAIGRPGAAIPGTGGQSGGRPDASSLGGRPGIDINTSSRPGNYSFIKLLLLIFSRILYDEKYLSSITCLWQNSLSELRS